MRGSADFIDSLPPPLSGTEANKPIVLGDFGFTSLA